MAAKKRKRKAAARRPHARAALRTRTTRRKRNPVGPAFPFTVEMAGGVVARFRSLARAAQYGRALANRSGRPVKVKS